MTSSTSKPKTLLSNGQTTDIVCNYCKDKGHIVKDCEKLEKKKEKVYRLRRKSTLSGEREAGKITLKNDVGKAPVRIWSLNVLVLKIHRIAIQTRKYKNRNITATSSSSQSTSKKDDSQT